MAETYTTEETVWLAIKARLIAAQSSTLSYVKKIYEGDRQVNVDYELPCIFMDIDSSSEEWVEFPRRRQNRMNIVLRGALDVRTRLDNQIVGDASQVGILRFESDIKKVFEGSDLKYDNYIQNYSFTTESRKLIDNAIREVSLRLRVDFKYFGTGERI